MDICITDIHVRFNVKEAYRNVMHLKCKQIYMNHCRSLIYISESCYGSLDEIDILESVRTA
jgi:hypothetical protein